MCSSPSPNMCMCACVDFVCVCVCLRLCCLCQCVWILNFLLLHLNKMSSRARLDFPTQISSEPLSNVLAYGFQALLHTVVNQVPHLEDQNLHSSMKRPKTNVIVKCSLFSVEIPLNVKYLL